MVRLLLPLLLLLTAAAPATRPAEDLELKRLIIQLGDGDPAVRDRAAEALLARGSAARPALLAATSSRFPEIAQRSRELLLRLPWHRASDPQEIRELLTEYGAKTDEEREGIIEQISWLKLPRSSVRGAMLRLLVEEPSASVRWTIAQQLRQRHGGELEEYRALDTRTGDGPSLALAGWAWAGKDAEKGSRLLAGAIEQAMKNPPANRGRAGFVFEDLIRGHRNEKRLAQAAELYRRWHVFDPPEEESRPVAVAELFALHARFGPVQGYGEDLKNYGQYLSRPEFLYCQAQIVRRQGQPEVANGLEAAAYAASPFTQDVRYFIGEFLTRHDMNHVAQRELLTVLALPGDNDRMKNVWDCNTHLRLANISGDREQHFEAAEHWRKALALLHAGGPGSLSGGTRESLEAQMHWRYVLAAKEKKDLASAAASFDALVALAPADDRIAHDVVPLLKELNRQQDALRLFEPIYEWYKKHLSETPEDHSAMNHLAWLCARSGERLEEALALATAAVKAKPDNAAYIDTLAEAQFRLGNREEAVRLETRALELQPGDKFMLEQLQRFREEAVPR